MRRNRHTSESQEKRCDLEKRRDLEKRGDLEKLGDLEFAKTQSLFSALHFRGRPLILNSCHQWLRPMPTNCVLGAE
jgi:hypothetical protein